MALRGHSINAYAYALNNPGTFVDPTGLFPDSVRLGVIARLATGNISGAIDYYILATGASTAPAWLTRLQTAFSVASQKAGECSNVARNVFDAFAKLGRNPKFVEITSTRGEFLSWRGQQMVSNNNWHSAVRVGDRIYDAYTGSAGMTEAAYREAMQSQGSLVIKVVETLSQ